jgi:hypothetical protein
MSSSANLRIDLRAGTADQHSVGLSSGTPVEAFVVGTKGSWQIQGTGVGPEHAYLFFDGTTAFVAAISSQYAVSVNGQPVGTDWFSLQPPCEIALGEAKLAVSTDDPTEFSPPPQMEETAAPVPAKGFDKQESTAVNLNPQKLGLKRKSRQLEDEDDIKTRIGSPAGAQFADDDVATRIGTPQQLQQPQKPQRKIDRPSRRIAPKADDEATRMAPIEEMVQARPQVQSPEQLPQNYPAPYSPAGAGPYVAPMQPPGFNPQAQAPQAFPQAPAPAPWLSPQPAGAPNAFGPPVPAPPGLPPGVNPARVAEFQGMAPALPAPGAPQATAGEPKPPNKVLKAWKDASIPQKFILVLMPFAFAAILVVFREPQQGHSKTAPSATVSAKSAPTASPPPTTSAPTTTAGPSDQTGAVVLSPPPPPPAPKPDKPVPPLPPGKKKEVPKSLERLAADAVAVGNYPEAIKIYDKLAAENPTNPTFKEAARILRTKLDPSQAAPKQ